MRKHTSLGLDEFNMKMCWKDDQFYMSAVNPDFNTKICHRQFTLEVKYW